MSATAAASAACDACGWAAAVCSMLGFGSFGVPIKSKAARSVDIDPLVFQSYKTFMCFVTSWLVLYGEDFDFTPWGIVSGLFWVPSGVATVYAIKSAGLAIGIGIGSSFIVLVSFVWGIFVFEEKVHSKFAACFAVFCMMLGLSGMSYFSSPAQNRVVEEQPEEEVVFERDSSHELPPESGPIADAMSSSLHRSDIEYRGLETHQEVDGEEEEEEETENTDPANNKSDGAVGQIDPECRVSDRTAPTSSSDSSVAEEEGESVDEETDLPVASGDVERQDLSTPLLGSNSNTDNNSVDAARICGCLNVSKRHLGMMSAMFSGVWGGSVLAPMKYCKSDAKGTGYLISFAIGASLVTLSLWMFRYLYNVTRYRSWERAYVSLPSFHLRVMWAPGGLAGLLWSIGNFFSLISVYYLGEGVGYPLSQTSILVSGLWGIFYFGEVKGAERIGKWILSSLLTIFGILLLSYEHYESEEDERKNHGL